MTGIYDIEDRIIMNLLTHKSVLIPILFIVLLGLKNLVFAAPTSQHYQLQTYGFGAGGVASASSDHYSVNGIAGESEGTQSGSNSKKIGGGLTYTQMANVPDAPNFSNPDSNYDRLKFVIHNGDNPADATFAIAITSDNWVTTKYIKSDYTVGDTLENIDWLTYTDWGGSAGKFVTDLDANTYFKIKVKARNGSYSESQWSADAQANTIAPSLTFGVNSSTITFDPLTTANNWTDDTKSTTITTSTNAKNGYTVFGHETGPLTGTNGIINDYASPNSNPTTWAGYGFGYSTSDNDLIGGTVDRFTNGGPKYAGFTTSAPGDPVADHKDIENGIPIDNEQFTINYRVTASITQAAGVYKNTILYVVVPAY
jgi:hypothetical protein